MSGYVPAVELKVFAGNASRALGAEICEYLDVPLGRAAVSRFSDGEIFIEVGENVRGRDCFVIQSTSAPVNDHLMELLIMIDALRRASADRITAVIPYYGYARQDRKVAPRTPISSKLVADLLTAAGANRVLAIELHAGQIQGFFNIPFDHLYGMPVLLRHMRERFGPEAVIVSPDAGGVERARAYSTRLGASLAIIDKRRVAPNVAEVMNIVGEIEDLDVVIVDDMIDTAGTITKAAEALKSQGARRVFAYAPHAVLSGPAIARLQRSPLDQVVVTNSIELRGEARTFEKLEVLSVANLLGEAIRRIHQSDSVSSLFV